MDIVLHHALVDATLAQAAAPGGGNAAQAIASGIVSLSVLALLALAFTLKAALIAAAVWLDITWPALCARAVSHYQERPRRCYVAGLINAAFGTFLALLLIATKVLAIVGLLMLVVLAFLVVLGFATSYRAAARRLDPDGIDALRGLVRGGIVTELVFLLPLLGQVYHLNVLVRGLGAATLAMLQRRRPA